MGALEKKRLKRIREYVINRDGPICCYCGDPLLPEEITLDHIVPNSKRGTFNSTNLTVSCYHCNNNRGNKPFFEYIKNFNFSYSKISKYKKMYFNNLRIKVLNIAKEECLIDQQAIPEELIDQACQILKIKGVYFDDFNLEDYGINNFSDVCDRKKIKYCFEQLIKNIEDNCN